MSNHQVVTKDYSENIAGGIMICGINFGYSKADEAKELSDVLEAPMPRSFFSDQAIYSFRFSARILKWLRGWGFHFATKSGEEGMFERSFFQTNWLDTQTRSVTSDVPITCKTLVLESDSFLSLVETRKPSVIIFAGSALIEALNDIQIRARVEQILGPRSGNAEAFRAELPGYRGTKFKVLTQKFGRTQIIGLPHPQARGLSDDYMAAMRLPDSVLQAIRDHEK